MEGRVHRTGGQVVRHMKGQGCRMKGQEGRRMKGQKAVCMKWEDLVGVHSSQKIDLGGQYSGGDTAVQDRYLVIPVVVQSCSIR